MRHVCDTVSGARQSQTGQTGRAKVGLSPRTQDLAVANAGEVGGSRIAFIADSTVKVGEVPNQTNLSLSDQVNALGNVGLEWLDTETLLFEGRPHQDQDERVIPLLRTSARGAEVDTAVEVRGVVFVQSLDVLPGERTVLASMFAASCMDGIEVHAIDLDAGTHRRLLPSTVRAWYVEEPSRLVFVRMDGTLLAVPFNPRDLEKAQGLFACFTSVSTYPG